MNIRQVLFLSSKAFRDAGFLNYRMDSELLLSHVLGKPREFLLVHHDKELTSTQVLNYNSLIERKMKNEPLAYILGSQEFYGIDFQVDENVLIPRAETELLVEKTIKLVKRKKIPHTFIDIGTGSGCIILSLAKVLSTKKNFSNFKFFAVDISAKALEVAKKNATNLKIEKNVSFFKGSLLSPIIKNDLLPKPNGKSQLFILANLPYLSKEIYENSEKSVKEYEPKIALESGEEGLDHYRKLFEQIGKIKKENKRQKITAFIEISPEQKLIIESDIKSALPSAKIRFEKDLFRRWRFVKIAL